MQRTRRIATQVGIAAAIMTTPIVVAAAAHAGPYSTSPITTSTSTPPPGGHVQITATGFKPNSSVQIYIPSTPILLATVTADANGVASASVQVPTTFVAGSSHAILAEGTDPSGNPLTDTLSITIAGGSSLPFTGVDAIGVSAAGAGRIGFGSFLLFADRRKRAARIG